MRINRSVIRWRNWSFPEAAAALKQPSNTTRTTLRFYNNLAFAYAHAERYPEAIDAISTRSRCLVKREVLTGRTAKQK